MNRRTFLVSSLALCRPLQTLADAQQQVSLRQKLIHDPFRPQFHLLPKANWMNDPCAPRFFRGQYHMFFQYNPHGPIWGDMHWAHATSPDLIHWKHSALALSPTPGSSDAYGCFTGSVLPGTAVPTILYTGVTKVAPQQETIRGEGVREVQCLATSTDPELRVWKKLEQPVIASPPPGLQVTGFRDPCPWKHGGQWYMIVGSGFNKLGGAVLLYTSADGRNWTYLHPLAQGQWNQGTKVNPVDTGEMWECPDFFPLHDKHVLLYSTERKVYWEVGTLDPKELRFHCETRGLLDHGSYYAMKSMLDASGRRILWGWVEETRTPAECEAAGWAGAMALPRRLSLGSDNRLRMEVPPEFASLRGESGGHQIRNRAGEIICRFKPGDGACGLELRSGATLLFTIQSQGSQPVLNIGGATVPVSPPPDGVVSLHLWMDGSVLEVFVDGKEAVTARCYEPSAGNVDVTWTGAKSALQSLQVWNVKPISPDRLTS